MTRRERLMATLEGRPVDRPAVSFYEIGGWEMAEDGDEFNVWNDPSWRPLVDLAHARTDVIRMVPPAWKKADGGELESLTRRESWRVGNSRFTRTSIRVGNRALTSVSRRDRDTQTEWVTEHLLKDVEDLDAYLSLPLPPVREPDTSAMLAVEEALGDAGILMVDTGDPICAAAGLFSMGDYTVTAMTEGPRFHRLLQRFAAVMQPECERISRALPGRLWRIYGPEYAGEPYLPPRLFDEYVVRYTGPMVDAVRAQGGYPRIHSHGRLRGILPHIAGMRPAGLDPLEPPPQGDMELEEIRRAIGADIVLFGNIEAADIENLPPPEFEKKVLKALREGTAGAGRGFILHPSSCPYGRTITPRTMENYRTMVRLAENWRDGA